MRSENRRWDELRVRKPILDVRREMLEAKIDVILSYSHLRRQLYLESPFLCLMLLCRRKPSIMQSHASPILLALLLSLTTAAIAIAVPHPINAFSLSHFNEDHLLSQITPPHHPQKRDFTLKIQNLPDGYTGIFSTFVSICPKLPATATFIRFFKNAAAQSATDPSPGRQNQRFTFGALALELVVQGQNKVVSREFVQAASLWLLDAAMKGWTGFFRAWVTDGFDNEVVEIRMGTVFDMPADDRPNIEP
ncbi:MAG: hypothetical protein ALECFALPRED_004971 [Alectoria fallacina]|uniref:Uncharacterized protein n=1 Tax=Alectoria fallacina TaxID=1903189 RepID=A0A8H3FUT4_9LECA|nr:MAG: hypothetical protein ALECFALPRED_004971 [Alectoria fallacina]